MPDPSSPKYALSWSLGGIGSSRVEIFLFLSFVGLIDSSEVPAATLPLEDKKDKRKTKPIRTRNNNFAWFLFIPEFNLEVQRLRLRLPVEI